VHYRNSRVWNSNRQHAAQLSCSVQFLMAGSFPAIAGLLVCVVIFVGVLLSITVLVC